METVYFSAPSEELLLASFPEFTHTYSSGDVHRTTVGKAEDGSRMDIHYCGQLVDVAGTYDAEGNELTPTALTTTFHANVKCSEAQAAIYATHQYWQVPPAGTPQFSF